MNKVIHLPYIIYIFYFTLMQNCIVQIYLSLLPVLRRHFSIMNSKKHAVPIFFNQLFMKLSRNIFKIGKQIN